MKRISFSMKALFVVSVLFLSGFVNTGRAQNDPTKEILVYFKSGVERVARGQLTAHAASAATIATLARFNIGEDKIASAFPDFNEADTLKATPEGRSISLPNMARIFRIQIPDGVSRDSVIESLKKLPNVLFAEKNMEARLFSTPTDPDYNKQWHLNNTGQSGGTSGADIRAEQAWSIFTGSSSLTIGVIDAGVKTSHEDLTGKATGDVEDGDYHGTHVAGIAAAIANNGDGGCGVDWSAQILSKQIFNTSGYMGDVNTYNKIVSAVNSGAAVLNNSWGGPNYSSTVRMAFAYTYKMNRVATVAMGNDYNNGNPTEYPAAFGQGIIAVGATTDQDVRSYFSQTGSWIDVVAPGGINPYPYNNQHDIWSTWGPNTDSYRYLAGTSMATPVVSGIASLLKGYNSSLDNDDIEHITQLSADKVAGMSGQDFTNDYGYGRVNAYKALRYASAPVVLNHETSTGGTDVGSTGTYLTIFLGVPGYADAVYIVRRHDVHKSITYSAINEAHVWGRGVSTTGASIESPNYGIGWCDAVSGTVTSTGATLRTYVYEVWNEAGQWVGWYPTTPQNVVYAYTVWGLPTTLSSGHIGPGVWHVTSSMNIPAGATVTIDLGATLKFYPQVSLTANGVLNANGTSSQPVTFTTNDIPAVWGSVVLSGSGASGSILNYVNIQYGTQIDVLNTSNVTIQHCNITNNSGHGINVNFSSGFLAQYNTIANSNYNHGILITGGSSNNCYDNVIYKTDHNRQGAGIQYSGSNGYVARNDIAWYNWGVGAIWGASPYARTNYGLMINNRITNCYTGLMVYRQSYPVFGTPPPSDYMWNSIYGNTYNARVGTSYPDYPSGLAAYGNWWGSAPPPSNYQVGASSYFYFNPYLSSDPWSGMPLPSIQAKEELKGEIVGSVSATARSEQVASLQSGSSTTQSTGAVDPTTADPLGDGIQLRADGKLKEAKDFFMSYLDKHPDNQRAYVELYGCYSDETGSEIKKFFESLPTSASKDHKLLLGYLYLTEGNVKSAKEINNGIIAENGNTSLAAKAKLNNFYIALYVENDPKNAAAILKEVVSNAKLSTETELSTAEWALETYVDPKTGKMIHHDMEENGDLPGAEVVAQDALIQNYPNPFNPSTMISYRLPNSGKVVLKVYDVLGREVMTLVNGYQDAGVHTAYFNGQNLASGVYFYRLTAPGITQVKKMLLTK